LIFTSVLQQFKKQCSLPQTNYLKIYDLYNIRHRPNGHIW
jgi:hypothetical protein